MPDAIIELDVSVPWEPPEGPGPGGARRRGAGQRIVFVAVVLVGVLLAGGSDRRPGLEPLWTAEFQVLAIDAAGGRLIVHRYQRAGADPVTEALDARTGAMLWRRPGLANESYGALTDRVAVVQLEQSDEHGRYTGRVVARDARNGEELWQRELVTFAGLAGDLVVVSEHAWPDEVDEFDDSYGSPEDPGVALPPRGHHERYLGLDQVSGAVKWSVELAPGTLPGFGMGEYPNLSGFSELGADGVLRVRDLRTGAVSGQYQLAFGGVLSRHSPGLPGQEVVLAAGRGGSEVFDLASGRRLWRWTGDSAAWNVPVPCLRVHYCVYGETGTEVLDAATGAVVWRARGYSAVLGDTGERLLMYRQIGDDYQPDDVAAFAVGGAGAVAWERAGWFVAGGYYQAVGARGMFVWRPVSNTDAIVGRLDPDDGTVHVFGRAHDFYGTVQCTATGDRVACLAIGVLFVWPLR
ncbi:PQQ-binding-like beta-propeller repeat protein [Dactylosporangium sp. CS-033363]|uniref:outer membrane protein assembly factor BamB family protein n=1 Tax=Dactylosporangium sp. CS-033363 TaxID=3239935 RepID=UPI003D8AACC2